MNDRHRNPRQPDQSLDPLLRRLAESKMDAEQIERLDRHWNQICRGRVRTRMRWSTAVVVVMSAGLLFAVRPVQRNVQPAGDAITIQPTDTIPRTNHRTDTVVSHLPSTPSSATIDTNVPISAYDHLLSAAIQRRKETAIKRPKAVEEESVSPVPELVRLTRERIDQNQEVTDLVERLRSEASEAQLLNWMQTGEDEASLTAALELLRHVATRHSLPVLFRMRSNPRFYEPCTRIAAKQAEAAVVFRLAQQEAQPRLRRELAAELLGRAHPESLYLFLQLVDDRRTSSAALAAVGDVPNLPLELLFECLSAGPRRVRLTAAMTLGRSGHPEVYSRLVSLLSSSRTSRAAMVALVASHDDAARQFVHQARHDLYLAAAVNAAQSVVSSFRLEG